LRNKVKMKKQTIIIISAIILIWIIVGLVIYFKPEKEITIPSYCNLEGSDDTFIWENQDFTIGSNQILIWKLYRGNKAYLSYTPDWDDCEGDSYSSYDSGNIELGDRTGDEVKIGSSNYCWKVEFWKYDCEKECDYDEEKCEGFDFYECDDDYEWDKQGIEKGECGVDCTKESHCGSDGYTGTKKCSGNNVVQTYRDYTCSGYKCSQVDEERTKETCTFGCSNGVCISGCDPKTCYQLGKECGLWDDDCGNTINCGSCSLEETCNNGICQSGTITCTTNDLRCSGNRLEVCELNQWNLRKTCEFGCSNKACIGEDEEGMNLFTQIAIGLGIALVIGFIIFLIFKRKK